MRATGFAVTPPAAQNVGAPTSKKHSVLRVFMMDLWCIIPYYTTYLCSSLTHEDVEVTLGSISYHFDPSHFRRNGIRNSPGLLDLVGKIPIRSSVVRRGLKFLESCINMASLPVRFALTKPNIIHVQYIPLIEEGIPFEIWLLKLARRMGIKLLYTVHNELPMDTGTRHVLKFRKVYHMMDALICHTDAAKDTLVTRYGVDPRRISVIPHGPLFHDARRPSIAGARAAAGLMPEDTVVLWQGWIKPYKGLSFLLDAWNLVAAKNAKAKLVIAGSGEPALLDSIRAQVTTGQMQASVRLDFRFIPPEQLPQVFTAADIIVLPYKEITTSGAFMTALSYGKALVTTRLPYFEETVGDSGAALIVDYGDVEGLAAALLRLIEDPEYRDQVGAAAAGLSRTDTTDWPDIARQTRQCYDALCSGAADGEGLPAYE